MFMLYRAINKSSLCLALLLLLPSHGGTSERSWQKKGTLVGTMSFVSGSPKTGPSLGDAANVTVELEYKGLPVCLASNEQGDYVVSLPKGTYCLKSARSADNKPLRFSPHQSKCFKIEPSKDTRFDVMLLKP